MAEARNERLIVLTESQLKQMMDQIRSIVREELYGKSSSIEYLGDVCTKEEASKALRVTRATIYAMLADGRLDATSDGRRVTTSSIRRYLGKLERGEVRRGRGAQKYV